MLLLEYFIIMQEQIINRETKLCSFLRKKDYKQKNRKLENEVHISNLVQASKHLQSFIIYSLHFSKNHNFQLEIKVI